MFETNNCYSIEGNHISSPPLRRSLMSHAGHSFYNNRINFVIIKYRDHFFRKMEDGCVLV